MNIENEDVEVLLSPGTVADTLLELWVGKEGEIFCGTPEEPFPPKTISYRAPTVPYCRRTAAHHDASLPHTPPPSRVLCSRKRIFGTIERYGY